MPKGKIYKPSDGFPYRLDSAAKDKGLTETRDLAEALYDNKECREIIKIRKRKKEGPSDPLVPIMKNIQIHYKEENAYKVNSEYLYAYSIILDCSLDYLYGKTDIKSSDLEIADICKKIGLNEKAITKIMQHHKHSVRYKYITFNKDELSKMIMSEKFDGFIYALENLDEAYEKYKNIGKEMDKKYLPKLLKKTWDIYINGSIDYIDLTDEQKEIFNDIEQSIEEQEKYEGVVKVRKYELDEAYHVLIHDLYNTLN